MKVRTKGRAASTFHGVTVRQIHEYTGECLRSLYDMKFKRPSRFYMLAREAAKLKDKQNEPENT